jgi:hypothetical protein
MFYMRGYRLFAGLGALFLWMICGTLGAQTTPTINAADPIIGTWKLNLGKSKYTVRAPAPVVHVEAYSITSDGHIEMTLSRQAAGAPEIVVSKLKWPAEGGTVGPISTEGRQLIETHLKSGEWYVTYLQNGKQYQTMHKVVSEDRKTMRQVIITLVLTLAPAPRIYTNIWPT